LRLDSSDLTSGKATRRGVSAKGKEEVDLDTETPKRHERNEGLKWRGWALGDGRLEMDVFCR
jgi:hypothetical protein